jgi:hypothetical protein
MLPDLERQRTELEAAWARPPMDELQKLMYLSPTAVKRMSERRRLSRYCLRIWPGRHSSQ